MLYDSYKKKILKWANLRDFLLKHKILVSIILIAIIGIMSTLLYFKGDFTSPLTCNEQFVYGEKLNCKSGAFLAITGYEFKEDGSDKWTRNRPTKPGTYQVRAIANTAFGRNYSNVEIFTISKKNIKISVNEESLPYGDTPTFGGELSYKDYVEQNQVRYTVSEINYDNTQTYDIYKSSIIIKNSNGEDVTNCYNVQVESADVKVLQREVTLEVKSKTKLYDGLALTSNDYELKGSLVSGDNILVGFSSSIVEAGSVENVPNISITNSKGKNVLPYYKINITKGYLTVEKRKLSIKTLSETREYNGKPLSKFEYNVTGGDGLISGHKIVVEEGTTLTNVGNVNNQLGISILDTLNNEVNKNYDISWDLGVLEIKAKNVIVETDNLESVYNGLEQYNENFKVSGIVSGEQAVLNSHNGRTDVGESPNYLSISIYSEKGETSSNYHFEYHYGTLKITPRYIKVKPENMISVYDGQFLRSSKVQVLEGSLALHSHICYITTEGSIKNVGKTDNILIKAQVFSGSEDVSKNYEIATENGTLEVTKREIFVKPKDEVKEYDGTSLKGLSYETTNHGYTVASGHRVSFEIEGEITDLGSVTTKFNSFVIYDEFNQNVTQNYIVNKLEGLLSIVKRKITILPDSIEVTYDGLEHSITTYTITSGSLLSGHQMTIKVNGSQLLAGVNNNVRVESFSVFNGNEDVTKYYEAVCLNGKITVLKRAITLHTGSQTYVYDGEKHVYDSEDSIGGLGLANGDSLVVYQRANPFYFGSYQNKILVNIVAEDSSDRTSCYDVTTDYGYITITKRELNIKLYGGEWVYDAQNHFNDKFDFDESQLASGDSYVVIDKAMVCNVEEIDNYIKIKITAQDESDRTGCYDIIYDTSNCKLKITPRPISISAVDTGKIYDGFGFGLYQTLVESEILSGSLASSSHYIVWEIVSGNIVNVSSSRATLGEGKIYVGQTDISYNYQITYTKNQRVNLSIEKRPITIKPLDIERYYDGTPLVSDVATVSSYSAYGLVEGHKIVIETQGSQTEFGRSENLITSYKILGQDDEPLTSNYFVTTEIGYLSISRRPLSVTTPSYTFDYDGSEKSYCEGWTVDGLPSNFEAKFISSCTQTDAGVYQNTIELEFYLNGENKTQNFKVNPNYGSLIINSLVIKVETGSSLGIVYDGLAHANQYYEILNIDEITSILVYNYDISLEASTQAIKVGTYKNKVKLKVTNLDDDIDTTKNFSILYPNGEGVIEIVPREISITTATNVKTFDGLALFDESYQITQGSLATGDSITVSKNTMLNDLGSVDNILEFSINSKNKDNRNSCYIINVTYGTLTMTKAPLLTINVTDVTRQYDGTPLTSTAYTISELNLYNLNIILETDGSQTFVGSTQNNVLSYEVMCGGKDVTTYFETIVVNSGMLTVTKRELALTVSPVTYIYNGKMQQSTTYFISTGSLAENEKFINLAFSGGSTNVNDNLSTTLVYDMIYSSTFDLDVTSNYKITINDGLVTIIPREVYIKPTLEEKVYDGETLYPTKWEYYGLSLENKYNIICENHTITCEFIGEQLEVGECASSLIVSKIVDENGSEIDLTNYNFYYETSTLTVHGIVIYVETESYEKVYDGEGCNLDQYTILNEDVLLNGHTLTFVSPFMESNVGEYANAIVFKVTDKDQVDVTSIYAFDYTGKIVITQREIQITTSSFSKVYDGTALTSDGYTVTSQGNGSGLISTHKLEILTLPEIIDVGSIDNEIVFSVYSTDASDLTDYSANYNFVYTSGKLSISARKATIKPQDINEVYDGTAKTATYAVSTNTKENEGLVEGETVEIISSKFLTNVGSVNDNEILMVIGIVGGRENLNNYEFTFDVGSIVVTQREIVIKPVDVNESYNGKAHTTNRGEACGGYALVDGHNIEIVSTSSQTEIGSCENGVKEIVGIFDTQGNNVSSNYLYDINDCQLGEIVVTPIKITITPMSVKVAYSGTNVYNQKFYARISGTLSSGYKLTYNLVVSGHTVVTDTPHIISVDTVKLLDPNDNECSFTASLNDFGEIVLDYGMHLITLKTGELIITPKVLTISSKSQSVVYDENLHVAGDIISSTNSDDCQIESGTLVSGEYIRFSDSQTTSITVEEYLLAGGELISKQNVISGVYIYYIDEL